ncbi:DUF6114 domain-containing protein [Streptomyces fuscigenes]|uniref:DUF6114 domain-containing protein n=1 Tax=Streptomyces fuscigenes TaxID=1528880 RepID=UPI001F1B366B|nr:DUF6114 domain-containing protein [Streptomyces fuscigenes]MCF3962331.1 DUF6114 domain-containing protein [Streptomyces fuscigenes]
MSAETADTLVTPERDGGFRYWRLRFRAWRGKRPFWAGLFTLLSGLPIAYFPYAHLHVGNLTLALATTAGAGSLIIGVLLFTLGMTMWFHSIVRVFAGVAAILLALVSIPVANLGGFVVGFLLALVGGCLSVSWAPGRPSQDTASEPEHPLAGRVEDESPGAVFRNAGPSGADSLLPPPRGGAYEYGYEADETHDSTARPKGGRHSAG